MTSGSLPTYFPPARDAPTRPPRVSLDGMVGEVAVADVSAQLQLRERRSHDVRGQPELLHQGVHRPAAATTDGVQQTRGRTVRRRPGGPGALPPPGSHRPGLAEEETSSARLPSTPSSDALPLCTVDATT